MSGDHHMIEPERPREERGVTKFLQRLDQIEAAGRAVFKAVVRVAELIALTVFFQAAAVLTNNAASEVLGFLLTVAVGLYVGVALGSVPEKLVPPRKATNKQAVLAGALFLIAAAGGFYLVQTISISIAQMAEEQIRDR